jgi:hypothetical protein
MRKASSAVEKVEDEPVPRSERRLRARRNAPEHKSFVLAMADALRDILRDEQKH